jgi:hypothetical protein
MEGRELACSEASGVPTCCSPHMQNGDGSYIDVGGAMVCEFTSSLFSARKARSRASDCLCIWRHHGSMVVAR